MYSFLIGYFNNIDKFNKLKPKKKRNKAKKANVFDTASELYNDLLEIYFYKYKALSDAKIESLVINMRLLIYFLKYTIIMSGLKTKNSLIQ